VKKIVFLTAVVISLSLVGPDQASAMMHREGHHSPYGGYCRGPKWGWYGARRDVKTVKEVRELLTVFLRGTSLTVGEIRDMKVYFEAEIVNGDNGEVVDVLIVDKRTCRIRSKY
jgi:hypothetical protein